MHCKVAYTLQFVTSENTANGDGVSQGCRGKGVHLNYTCHVTKVDEKKITFSAKLSEVFIDQWQFNLHREFD